MLTVVVVIEKSGWDWATTVALVASIVAVLALVLNYLMIPKPHIRFEPKATSGQVWVENIGNTAALLLCYRTVTKEGGKLTPPKWVPIGSLEPDPKDNRLFPLQVGERLEVRYVYAPLLGWQHIKRHKRRS